MEPVQFFVRRIRGISHERLSQIERWSARRRGTEIQESRIRPGDARVVLPKGTTIDKRTGWRQGWAIGRWWRSWNDAKEICREALLGGRLEQRGGQQGIKICRVPQMLFL